MVTITEPSSMGGGTETIQYDGNDQRVAKINGSNTTVYVYDLTGQLAAEYSTNPSTAPCSTCYLSTDQLGTPRLITDGSDNLIARHDYLPFGEEIGANTAGRNSQWGPANDNVNQKFTGQERDSETGLDYFQARYMASTLGRFISPDPENAGADLTDPQTWNGYSYVRNSPLTLVDPSGQSFWSIFKDILDVGAIIASVFDFGVTAPEGIAGLTGSILGAAGGAAKLGSDIANQVGGSSGHRGNAQPVSPPISSFPNGESLGIPTGMSFPGPFGLPGSGCDFGVCTGGVGGSGFQDPTTATAAIAACVTDPMCLAGGAVVLGGAAIIYHYTPPGSVRLPNDNVHYDGPRFVLESPPTIIYRHKKNARPSTEEKHEKGEARGQQDRGNEKGDERRRPPRKRPDGWKGPWPPLPNVRWW